MNAIKFDGVKIGQLAKAAGVNVETIRYYERLRLLQPVARMPSRYRLYAADSIRRLTFIKRAQELGFTLREVGELLNLRVSTAARCEDVRQRAKSKLNQIHAKLRDLGKLAESLERLIKTCRGGGYTDDCPILHALEVKVTKEKG